MVAAQAAPATALASDVSVAAEQELSVVGATARGVLQDGVIDAWTQDQATVKGTDAVNEKTDAGWLHLKAGSGNDNSASVAAKYPAVFVNPNTFDFTKAGYFEFDLKPITAADNARFGVYLQYTDPGNGMFIGYDKGGWFWQKYTNGDGDYYSGARTAAPAAGVTTKVRIDWTADGKFSLTVGGAEVFKEEASGLTHTADGKIGLKCSTFSGNMTEVELKNIHYTGQAEVASYKVTGKIVDANGAAVSGASVTLGEQTVTTAADGTYTFEAVAVGTHAVTVTKSGYGVGSGRVTVENGDTAAADITLPAKPAIETRTLKTDEMDVQVAAKFPYIVQYDMKGDLAGKVFYGQTSEINTIKINGTAIQVKPEDIKATFEDKKAVYVMTLKASNIDCVITAEISADKNTASFDITKVENKLTEKDENGYEVYPVQTIEIPNHSLISVNSAQPGANLKAAKMSSNTLISGDKYFDVTATANVTEDFMYGFVSNHEMSAGLWSNSEYQGTHVASYIKAGGASNTRVMATTTKDGGTTSLGLASTAWYYDRKVTPTVNGKQRTYVLEHEIMPSAKVVITGDENKDGGIDWQDGAVAFRSIMHDPQGCEEVPELVNYRIAMNFGSMAANPFLSNLDGVKRVYLNTDGLGQGVLLKGYGSEGHDSGHPDYGNIGERIGGAEDMNTLLKEGKKMGALFGVHVNASEMYAESQAFDDDLSRGIDGINVGWNWLDQGIGINSLYDLASRNRLARFQELHDKVGNNLDFIYVDVWGNGVSGAEGEDAWCSRMLAREINGLGWRLATEWGPTQEYDSTLQHWAADLTYGDHTAKGENSAVMRFLRNHQKDSWVADFPYYNGAAQAPLLGGLDMTDFEGWQGRTGFKKYITIMFRHNLITKYLQHYQVVDWIDADTPVTMTAEPGTDRVQTASWTPEMQITLRNTEDETDNTEIVVKRDSADYNDLQKYRSRTITVDGIEVSKGAVAGESNLSNKGGSMGGNETYLIPWNWDANGDKLADADKKLYHWNTLGGTTTWTLTKDWQGLKNVVVYELTDEGKKNMQKVDVVDNQITLKDVKAETPYVVYRGEKAPLTVDWQSSKYVYDMGFNDTDVNSHRTVSGTGTASIVDNVSENNMLKLEGEVSVSTELTNLTVGQKYALYVGVDNRSESRAYVTVTDGDKVLGTNYTGKSFVENIVSSDQHHTAGGATTADGISYFQNMYVFFTAEHETATLNLKRDAGEEASYFDDIRIVETEMDVIRETDEEGNITALFNDFEHNAQGIYPFVISGPVGSYPMSYYVADNRIHLSERHGEYTQAEYKKRVTNGEAAVDDVLDGDWSVKINALVCNNSMIYQTIPQNFHFEPGETYYVSFDYQTGSTGTYEARVGDGTNNNVKSFVLPEAAGETKRFGFSFTAGESEDSWVGIYSTSKDAESHGLSGNLLNFAGLKDFVLDNIQIQKTSMTIDKTYTEVTTAKDKIALKADFVKEADKGTEVIWESSDENVARVNSKGEVYFVGFGTAMITAKATVDGKETKLSSTVYFPDEYRDAGPVKAWANVYNSSSESASMAIDGDTSTHWHSPWKGYDVSESNPAVITVKLAKDISEYEMKQFLQRSTGGTNGVVKKYQVVVGDSFDEETHTISNPAYTSGTVTTAQPGLGKMETLDIPEGTKGHYLQIRVVEGEGNFASIGEIQVQTVISYDTPEERGFMEDNQKAYEADKKEEAVGTINEALAEAEEIYKAGQGNMKKELWDAFVAAYTAAKAANSSMTLEQLSEIAATLKEAQNALKTEAPGPDVQEGLTEAKKALSETLKAAEAVYAAGGAAYTEASWKAFADAYAAAKNPAANADAAALKALAEALKKAQGGLVKAASPNPTPTDELKKGDTVTVKNVVYKVTNADKKTVAAVKGKNKKLTSVSIASTVKVKGEICKVTAVNAKAFKGYAKLKKVTIGKNVTTVGKQAFYGCKKLTKVSFKGTAVKSIKAAAFKKANAKIKVTLPKKLKGKNRAKIVKQLKKAGVKSAK